MAKKIEYLFCQNTKCSVHTSALLGKLPADSPIQAGKPCPRCGKPIERIEIDASPAVAKGGGTATAIVLPGAPYGGFMLQRGDDDSKATWEGATQTGHDGAHYVAELQHDLLRIAHYGPARGGETLGKFSLQLMGCVLDFKDHLTGVYGIGKSDDLAAVNAAAGQSGASIHFPVGGLVSPGEALGQVAGWAKLLGQTRSAIPLQNSLKQWEKQWTDLTKLGAPVDVSEIDGLLAKNLAHQKQIQQLTKDRIPAAKAIEKIESGLVQKQSARNGGTLTEENVAALESLFDDGLAKGNAVGTALEPVATELRETDPRIPGKSGIKDPGDLAIVVTPAAAGATPGERFDRLKTHASELRAANSNQLRLIDFCRALQQNLRVRLDRLATNVRKLDTLASAVDGGVAIILEELPAATSAAASLNQFARGKSGKANEVLKNARKFVAAWLDEADGTTKGSFSICQDFMAEAQKVWQGSGVDEPPTWPKVQAAFSQLSLRVASFRAEVDAASAEAWDAAYLEQLKAFGTVDRATAHYIKEMVTTGQLAGRGIFRVPVDDEIDTFSKHNRELKKELPRLIDETVAKVGRPPGEAPQPILEFIFLHESGAKHSGEFAGKMFVKLGIDWPNSSTSNASFHETLTPGRKLSTSRGWGATQKTLFSEVGMPLKGADGKVANFTNVDGIPINGGGVDGAVPAMIASEEEGVLEGALVFVRGFQATVVRRECSFEPNGAPTGGSSYDCKNCAKRLVPGPSKKTGGGVVTFEDDKGDFERVVPEKGKRLPLYRMRKLERLRELVGSGFYSLPDGRTADEANSTDLNEFPCSWLAAISHYSGVSRRGFDYMLEALQKMAK